MLRAIDVQQVILQIEQAGKVQQVQQQHPEMQQKYFELKLREEKKLLQEKVSEPEEAEGTSIKERDERAKQRSAGGQRDRGERPLNKEGEGADETPQEGGHINITV